jgi:hypothetical protein
MLIISSSVVGMVLIPWNFLGNASLLDANLDFQ